MKLYDIAEPSRADNDSQFVTSTKNEIAVGIDLGTTNSLIGIAENGKVRLFEAEDGKTYVPSVVKYKADEVIVGSKAKNDTNRDGTISSVKRLMSKGKDDEYFKSKELAFIIDESAKGLVKVLLDGKSLTAVEISADILKQLKANAERGLGKPVNKAVITVPAYFDEAARQATKDAAILAGIEVLRLLSEPTAAAIAYGLDENPEGIYAIYDLGGGTFDVSILKMQQGILQVLATGGDHNLGGDDIDELLLSFILSKYKKPNKYSIADRQKALGETRKIKEHLSNSKSYSSDFIGIGKIEISQAEYIALITHIVDRTIDIFKKTLKDAEIKKEELAEVILVGGSTRIPLIKQKLAEVIGKQALDHINPDEIVAIGASIQAENLIKGSSQLLLDVVPLSLGIELADGTAEHIIQRNTPIPVFKTQLYTTHVDNQTGLIIHVLQGESHKAHECRSISKFELKGLPPMSKGVARIEITFQIDADGVLSVRAKELITGLVQEVVAKPSYGLTEDELIKLLALNK